MLYVDLDSFYALSSATGLPFSELGSAKRGTTRTFQAQFVRAGVVTELSAGASGLFGFKLKGKRDSAGFAAVALSWVQTGSGTSSVYTFTVSFSSTPIDAGLKVDGDDSNDLASIVLEGEIQWTDSAGTHKTQNALRLTLENDIARGGESFQTHAPLQTTPYLKQITRETGGTASDLDAIPTLGLFGSGDLILTRIGGFAGHTFDPGPADGTDGGQVAPNDYDGVTNDFHWTRRI